MAIFDEEQVVKILNTYNPWWKTAQIPSDYLKEMKRTAYYETEKIMENKTIRRFVILSGARRVGKTTILYQIIQKLLEKGINEKNILYVSLDNPILKFGTLDKIMDIYINNVASSGEIYILYLFFLGIEVNNSSLIACKPSITKISFFLSSIFLLNSFSPVIKLNVGAKILCPFNNLPIWLLNNFTSIARILSKSGFPYSSNGVSVLFKK